MHADESVSLDDDGQDDETGSGVDERFVFEVVERVHDRVLGGIDVLDNVLVAIVAAVAAVVVLAIDELSDFGMPVFVLLVVAIIVCVAGWFWGRVPGYSEVPDLATFIVRVSGTSERGCRRFDRRFSPRGRAQSWYSHRQGAARGSRRPDADRRHRIRRLRKGVKVSDVSRKKPTPAEKAALRQLGRRIAAEMGIEPMARERDPETGRFDPPGFYGVRRRPMFDWRQFLASNRDVRKKP